MPVIDVARVRAAVATAEPLLRKRSEGVASAELGPGEWSSKQLLGHLCDSAMNNSARIVCAQIDAQLDADRVLRARGYEQEDWVRVCGYDSRPWTDVVDLWVALNRHLCAIAERFDDGCLGVLLSIDGSTPTPIGSALDYPDHLDHHLADLLRV